MTLEERAIGGQFRDVANTCPDPPTYPAWPAGWGIAGNPATDPTWTYAVPADWSPGASPCHLGIYMVSDGSNGGCKTTINAAGAVKLTSDVCFEGGATLTIYLNGVNVGTAGGGDAGVFIDLTGTVWPASCELKILCQGEEWMGQILDSISVLAEGCLNFAPIWSEYIGEAMTPP